MDFELSNQRGGALDESIINTFQINHVGVGISEWEVALDEKFHLCKREKTQGRQDKIVARRLLYLVYQSYHQSNHQPMNPSLEYTHCLKTASHASHHI
jgi:hypothetical protein